MIDLADGRPAALEVRGGTPAQALAAAGDLRLTFVVERPTEDLLQLDPNRVTISVLDGPGLQPSAARCSPGCACTASGSASPTSAPAARRSPTSRACR